MPETQVSQNQTKLPSKMEKLKAWQKAFKERVVDNPKLKWYRRGAAVKNQLAILSQNLGAKNPAVETCSELLR